MKLYLAPTIIALGYASFALAKTKVINEPVTYQGNHDLCDYYRLDWCQQFGNTCGGPAAHTWCRSQGYDYATEWKVDRGLNEKTLTIGDNKVCDPKKVRRCDGFKSITCQGWARYDNWSKIGGPKYHYPSFQGTPLNTCLVNNQKCSGKEAADAYCKLMFYFRAKTFKVRTITDKSEKTRLIGEKNGICDPKKKTCKSFRWILCENEDC